MPISKILDHPTEIVAVAGLVLSAFTFWLGNRMALGRDKRNEFNALTQGVTPDLAEQVAHLKAKDWWHDVEISYHIEFYIPRRHRSRYRAALEGYQATSKIYGPYQPIDGVVPNYEQNLAHHLRFAQQLLGFLKRR